MFNEKNWLAIHTAIHTDSSSLTIQDKYGHTNASVETSKTGCRFIKCGPYTFIEQNKQKNNTYGAFARSGHKITWVIRPHGKWGLIVDGKIKRR